MNGKTIYWVDQYGHAWGYTKTIAELAERITGNPRARARPMYCDGKDSRSYRVGSIIAGHWCSAFTSYRIEC
jgi:hypothetical protein